MNKLAVLLGLLLLQSCQSTTPGYSSGYRPNYQAAEICVDGQKRPVLAKDPQWLVRIEPKYPADAAKNNVQGHVKLQFAITPQGDVSKIEVLESVPAGVFDAFAVKALQRWKYRPGCVDGHLAEFTVQETLPFTLDTSNP